MEAQYQLDDTAVTSANPMSDALRGFMQAPNNFSKEAQKRRKTMGPLQFSQ
jgi:hypothetical protein